jgi:hypothetical protein
MKIYSRKRGSDNDGKRRASDRTKKGIEITYEKKKPFSRKEESTQKGKK